ncbi:MAG: hypothetical protein ABSG63_10440, partial [Spirochaetia bacterium]
YEENPALQMFEPQPQLPSQQRGTGGAQGAGAGHGGMPNGGQPQAAAPQPAVPAQPAQLTLSPQGESVLANSLKETVSAQSRVVDKLFDEMKELSRKIDERKQAPQQMPPVILNMQSPAAAGPASMKPIVMDMPPGRHQAEGLPRYATSDMGEEEQEEEKAPQASPPPKPRPAANDDVVELEEIPEDMEFEEPEARKPDAAPAELHAEPAPPPKGWPGLDPITDTEPEPEIATEMEEQAEELTEELPDLPPLEEAAAAAPEETPAPEPAPAPRASDEVRQELRDYLSGVRDRLESGAGTPSGPADLLDYLEKLSDYLPEREKKRFQRSPERLAMESLKARLAGKHGLRQKVAEKFRPDAPRRKEPMTRSLVVDTFSYLKDLTAWLPDQGMAKDMKKRIDSIVTRMGRSH